MRKYDAKHIESKWQKTWHQTGLYHVDLNLNGREKFYFLSMFPYPSGNLHVGHWYAEAPADTAARFKRMQGYNVFFPMGFDAFGLPAENAAIRAASQGRDVHPAKLTYGQIEQMERQFAQMGAMFDWSKKVITSDPEYYKWNQWFFLKLFERDLAYRKYSHVDWCPSCNTTIAREQVVGADRVCERCDTPVTKRKLNQWFFRITQYAEELLDFGHLDWPEEVKLMQTNWIGKSVGAEIDFEVIDRDATITAFTTKPHTAQDATFIALAPEHPLAISLCASSRVDDVQTYLAGIARTTEIERSAEGHEVSGVFTGTYAKSPVSNQDLPIWIASYVLPDYGTGVIMGVPSDDPRDLSLAQLYKIESITVRGKRASALDANALHEGHPRFGPMRERIDEPGEILAQYGVQRKIRSAVRYRLRDWLVSRQRYWGTPIPIVYCDSCGTVAVPEKQLPIPLPPEVEFLPTGESPLKFESSFLNTACPKCGGAAVRETDTMDTFVDSSWYWLRYLSPALSTAPVDRALADRWLPVDLYTGGIEHATMHLLYARFFTKALADMGVISIREPFQKLRNQGIILGPDYRRMSKSRGNVVDPDQLVDEYGADAVRLYLMFIGPWHAGGPWNHSGIEGVVRFLHRAWSVVTYSEPVTDCLDKPENREAVDGLRRKSHETLKGVTQDLEVFQFNTAIAKLMKLCNEMHRSKQLRLVAPEAWAECQRYFVTMLAPFAPHIAEELWEFMGNSGSVHQEEWPQFDSNLLLFEEIQLIVQVDGRVRGQIVVFRDDSDIVLLEKARGHRNVASYLKGKTVTREVVVPGRLINFVTS